jgi:transcriptional regulator with XRE-family HTH domain
LRRAEIPGKGILLVSRTAQRLMIRVMRLRDWRLSQTPVPKLEQLARMCGCAVTAISKIERGDMWPGPSLAAAIRIATKRAVTADDLLDARLEKMAGAEVPRAPAQVAKHRKRILKPPMQKKAATKGRPSNGSSTPVTPED